MIPGMFVYSGKGCPYAGGINSRRYSRTKTDKNEDAARIPKIGCLSRVIRVIWE